MVNFNDVANLNSQRFEMICIYIYIHDYIGFQQNKNKFAINNNHQHFPTTARCCTGPTESESIGAVQHAKLEGTMFQVRIRWFKVHGLNLWNLKVGVTMHTCEWERPSCDCDVFLKGDDASKSNVISKLALLLSSDDNSSLHV